MADDAISRMQDTKSLIVGEAIEHGLLAPHNNVELGIYGPVAHVRAGTNSLSRKKTIACTNDARPHAQLKV